MYDRIFIIVAITAISLAGFSGCTTETTRPDNLAGRPTTYEDSSTPGVISSIGIESQDIVSVTDRMMRDILANRNVNEKLVAAEDAPRIVVDSSYFINESTSRINKNLLTDRLRTELNRAAAGRMIFLARHHANMVEKERILEEEGVVTGGSKGPTKSSMGYDYRLGGRIASLDAVDPRTGMKSRYHQITFELIERGSSVIVWGNTYEFKKSAQDSVLYR